MDNRRPPSSGSNPDKNFSRGSYYKKPGENNFGQKTFQPRENNFQPRDDRFAPRRDDRFAPRGENSPPRDGRFQPRDNRFPPRDSNGGSGRFQSRDENSRPRENGRFQPRRDERTEGRGERFPPRKTFIPRGGKPVPPWKRIEKPRIYDEMQITDGKHIGKLLKSTDSPKVRPTARRIREAMFKLIFRRVRAGRFLDLCAGSGAVGMEAISRGALVCSFVERSAKMCGIIKKNMESCGIKEGHGEVFEIEVVPFLKQMAKRRRFWDVVFFDPPYDTNYDEVLSYLSRGVCIKPHGTLVIEHHAEMFFPEKLGVLQRWRVVIMGDTALSFYERK
jgi:16S rRNA (guanine966-N2)-methyltransferase